MLLNKYSDSDLWEAIMLDDTKAFETLFERYWSIIYGTAFSYLKDKEACTEIVQDIFLNIWQKIVPTKVNSIVMHGIRWVGFYLRKIINII